ncbi:phage tail tape measure protein [Streptosporangium canum]|uniref:phage tail tape measure protein n=1 Tax=Streptosporangium canum TaxID=324952 RepID=UPI0033AE9C6C
MALTVGELVAYAQLDTTGFEKGLAETARDMSKLQSSTSSSMASMESTVTRAMSDVATSIGDGFDPTEVLADIDRMVSGFAADLDRMEAEAGAGAQGVVNELRTTLDDVEDVARRAGRDGGQGLVEGLREELREAERVARGAGDDAGREFGDGTEQTGRGRMSGVADGFMSSLKAAPWLAAGAAIGAVLMDGFTSALDAEQAKQKLYAQLGTTGAESEKLGKVAGALYAQGYGESVGDVTGALKSVVQATGGYGKVNDEVLQRVTGDFMNLADILDEDVSAAIDAARVLVSNGMAKDFDQAGDVILGMYRKLGDSGEDALDTLREYSPLLKSTGLDAKTLAGIFVQAGGESRNFDVIADAMKEVQVQVREMTPAVKAALGDLGLSWADIQKRFAKGDVTALDDLMDKLRQVEDPIKRNQIATALFTGTFENLGDALFKIDPSAAVGALGQVDGSLKKAGDTLHDTATNKIEQWKRGMQEGVVDFVGGTVLPGLEKLADGFELSGALEQVREWAGQLGEIWDSVVADVREWVEDNKATIDGWKTKFEEGFGSISEIVDTALATVKEIWDEYGDEIIVGVTFLVDTFLNIWNGFWGIVSGLVSTIKGILTGDFDEMKDGLLKIWDSLWGLVEDTVTTGLNAIAGFMGTTWEQLKSDASAAWERLVAAVTSKVSELVADAKALPGKIKAVFANAGTWLLQIGMDLIQGLINGVKAKAQEVVNTVKGIAQSMIDVAKKVIDSHSPSKVFEQIGQWTVQGLVIGLTKEEGNVKSTVEKMVSTIKTAFESKPDVAEGLIDFVRTGNKNLEDLALQREALVKRLADAKEYAKKVAGSAQEWASITGLKPEELMGAGDMASELQDKARSINDFASNIQKLAKMGLNKKVLQDIIDAGVEKGATFAEMLVGSDGSEIKALNKAQEAVDKASKKLGKASADAMYDTGKKAGEGYLKGLEESLKDLDKAMEKIVKALVAAIKKELKIKSPSQVMAEIGVFTMAGLIEGMQSMESATLGAMTGLVGRAVSATSDAALGSIGKAAAASTTKIGIVGAVGDGGHGGKYDGPLISPGSSVPAGGGITVNMPNAVIREEADVHALGREFGFEVAVQA